MDLPNYRFNGRIYKTVAGLSKALFKDCGCDSHSMVVDRIITATTGRKPNERIVARYYVSPPVPGKAMDVKRLPEIPTFTPEEIADAQGALDLHPNNSTFWESRSGQDHLQVIRELKLEPKTSEAKRRAGYRDAMVAARCS